MTNNPTIDGVSRFWCHEAQNIRCVRESDYDALQSTIAQLQARVAELESGRGEPVAWMTGPIVWGYKVDANRHADAHGMTVIPLFTAPSAPSAVVLPEQLIAAIQTEQERLSAEDYLMDSDDCIAVIREVACLDATAALNEVKRNNTKIII